MKYIYLIFLIIFLSGCCMFEPSGQKKAKFDISVNQKDSLAIIHVNISNPDTAISIAMMYSKSSLDYTHTTYLDLQIILNDSIIIEPNIMMFDKTHIPSAEDYTILKPLEQKDFIFKINFNDILLFNKLTSLIKIIDTKSAPSGRYSFQVFYHDPFKNHCLAVDSAISNKMYFDWK